MVTVHMQKLVLNKVERFFVLSCFPLLDDLVDLIDASCEELRVASHHLIVESVCANLVNLD
jgi:hypothetical protein